MRWVAARQEWHGGDSDPHQDLSWKMAIWPTARPWSAAPRGFRGPRRPRGPRTSEQKGQGHFEKDIFLRHYGNITPKIRTKVTKLLGLECLEWEFRFRFTVIHQSFLQVMSSVAPKELEFDTWIYSGQFHEGLRTAPDGTGWHRHLSLLESCRTCRICRWHPQEWKWPVRMAGGWILV